MTTYKDLYLKQKELIEMLEAPQYHEVMRTVKRFKSELASLEEGMEKEEFNESCGNWIPDKGTSATRCAVCGKDRWQHPL